MEIKIMLWNCGGWRNKHDEMRKRLREEDVDIGIITETKMGEDDKIRMTGYDIARQERRTGAGKGGGVMILIKKKIKWENIQSKEIGGEKDNMEIKGIRIKSEEKCLNVVGIYRKSGTKTVKNEWESMIENVETGQLWLMAGDYNAHSKNWNCLRNNKVGIDLNEAMEDKGLYVVNESTSSWLGDNRRKASNLDLAFTTEEIYDRIKYKQGKDTWGSDHYPIFFKIELKRKAYKKKGFRISTSKTDWRKYKALLEDEEEYLQGEEFNNKTYIERYEWVCNKMREITIEAKRGKKASNKERGNERKNERDKEKENRMKSTTKNKKEKYPVEWWDLECEEIVKQRKSKLKEFKRTRTIENYKEFKKAKKETRKVIRTKKTSKNLLKQ